jgi:hypothetical protein
MEDEMDGVCRKHGRNEKFPWNSFGTGSMGETLMEYNIKMNF